MRSPAMAGGALLLMATTGLAWGQPVTEPATGVTFAAKVGDQSLLGVGVRIKKVLFIHAKVYAIGLYVSDAALAGALAVHKGKPITPAFYKDLVRGDFDKELTLKFVRNLGQEQIQEAMREALSPRTDPKLLSQFVSYFPAIKVGDEAHLRWASGGILETTMVGQVKPPIADRGFTTALFGLYLGEQPLQEELKAGLVSRAAELLRP